MATPRISRSRPTSLHECAAKVCRAGGIIAPNSVYVGCSVPLNPNDGYGNSYVARRLTTNRYHVQCFVSEHPDIVLEMLKGYERLGEAARDALQPPRSLWDHLAAADDE